MSAFTKQGNDLVVGFCLDESGSMEPIRQQTIDGFNNFIDGLREQEGGTTLSLTMFSDQMADRPTFRPFCEAAPLANVPRLTTKHYAPNGGTPLYDAIGNTILRLQQFMVRFPMTKAPVLFVIQTDGLENASREFTRAKVFDLIRMMEGEAEWKFIYLGADQDAYTAQQASTAMGMSVGSSVHYSVQDTASAYAGVTGASGMLRTNVSAKSDALADSVREALEDAKGKP